MYKLIEEAKRQVEICNACRYCEGYCSVFPEITKYREFSDETIVQLANLCHNCRGCYYSCQYTSPHEFALNVPKVLAEVRQDSWEKYAWPQNMGRSWQRNGLAIAAMTVIGFTLILALLFTLGGNGEGFYAKLSHNAMVAIFLPAFLFPVVSLGISIRRYWTDQGGGGLTLAQIKNGLMTAATMKNLDGGHGSGCNFEEEDRFSNARRYAHQLTMYGFLLCFAATSVATLMHYIFSMPAPYAWYTPPKLLGIPGGIALSIGTAWLITLKLRSERHLADERVWKGELAFVILLFWVSTTGLALYALGGTSLLTVLLAIHLGSVFAFFVLMPFSKMAHGFYRLAALLKSAKRES